MGNGVGGISQGSAWVGEDQLLLFQFCIHPASSIDHFSVSMRSFSLFIYPMTKHPQFGWRSETLHQFRPARSEEIRAEAGARKGALHNWTPHRAPSNIILLPLSNSLAFLVQITDQCFDFHYLNQLFLADSVRLPPLSRAQSKEGARTVLGGDHGRRFQRLVVEGMN